MNESEPPNEKSITLNPERDWHGDYIKLKIFFPGDDPRTWTPYQFFGALIYISNMDVPHVVTLDPRKPERE